MPQTSLRAYKHIRGSQAPAAQSAIIIVRDTIDARSAILPIHVLQSARTTQLTSFQNSFTNAPQFDILLITGSFTITPLPPSATTFLTTQISHPHFLALMSIASGILPLTQTSILYQRRASAPRSLLPTLKQRYPETAWRSTPWERHEKLWTSNSAVSALDMVRSFMREYFWDRGDAVEAALEAAGIGRLDECE
jgi:transcriptional regulator GlxA family with amidase domain